MWADDGASVGCRVVHWIAMLSPSRAVTVHVWDASTAIALASNEPRHHVNCAAAGENGKEFTVIGE